MSTKQTVGTLPGNLSDDIRSLGLVLGNANILLLNTSYLVVIEYLNLVRGFATSVYRPMVRIDRLPRCAR